MDHRNREADRNLRPEPAEQLAALWRLPEQDQARFFQAVRDLAELRDRVERDQVVGNPESRHRPRTAA